MKRTKLVKTLLFALPFVLAGCKAKTDAGESTGGEEDKPIVLDDFYVTYKGEEYDRTDTSKVHQINAYVNESNCVLLPSMVDGSASSFVFSSSDDSIASIGRTTGVITIKKEGGCDLEVSLSAEADKKMKFHLTITKPEETIGGVFDYRSTSYKEKEQILGQLENYAVNNYLTGLTLFSNGGTVCYNTRYTPVCKENISGYGWGTFREGKLDHEIENPLAGHNPKFYQNAYTEMPKHINGMNSNGSLESDEYDFISNSYYSTRMNKEGNGYEWVPVLATDHRPIAVNRDGTAMSAPSGTELKDVKSNRWRIHLRKDVKYRTASKKSEISKFDQTEVKLEDYLTPFKLMLSQYNHFYRGAELTQNAPGFAGGSSAYYSQTSEKEDGDTYYSQKKWDDLLKDVIEVGTESNGDWYIQFNLKNEVNQFYAMYNLSSSLYSPIPAEFITAIGGAENYGTLPDGYTPVDTVISTGPYYLTGWNSTDIQYTKNDKYFITEDDFGDGNKRELYRIPGLEIHKYADEQRKSAFLNGEIDGYAPKEADLTGEFKSDEGAAKIGTKTMGWKKYTTKGDSNFKININATTTERWNEMFGPQGNITKHTQSQIDTDYSDIITSRPILSNYDFLDFLSFGLDRKAFCESRGRVPTQDYFSDNYLINPEDGLSYNVTSAHKSVLASRFADTYGYNRDAAKNSLKKFLNEKGQSLIDDGTLKQNKDGKYEIKLVMNWMAPEDPQNYSDTFDSQKAIFSELNASDFNNKYALNIETPTPSSNFMDVYNKLQNGTFELGIGAITGNPLDPINFMEVLRSNNSSGFTLNWGVDTSKVNSSDRSPIIYEGHKFSFDGLWLAHNNGVILDNDGKPGSFSNVSQTHDDGQYESLDDTNYTVTYKLSFKKLVEVGAKNITLAAESASGAVEAKSITELGANESNEYVATFTVPNSLNDGYGDAYLTAYFDFDKVNPKTHATETLHLTADLILGTYEKYKNIPASGGDDSNPAKVPAAFLDNKHLSEA